MTDSPEYSLLCEDKIPTMNKDFITDKGFRFKSIAYHNETTVNLVFLPGGPGLGSEYYLPWLYETNFPTNLWRLDFPGDGSNIIDNDSNYSEWREGLIHALSHLKKVVLVTHSFSGMFVLTMPDLENKLIGLVLMSAAPNIEWLTSLPQRVIKYELPDISAANEAYQKNKNNETFKKFTLASWRYFFPTASQKAGLALLEKLPYNYKPYDWIMQNFYPNFIATWVPQQLPTLILTGEADVLTPMNLFLEDHQFKRNNILVKEIKKAGHFPWIEKPVEVRDTIAAFILKISR